MNRRILGGLTAALLAVGFALTSGAAVQATRPSTVHHPESECSGTFIKDQGPNSGLSVTAAYTGNMWIKAGAQHVAVPAVTKGETYTPSSLSGWPMNTPGNAYLEISHIDYCVTDTQPPSPPVWTPPTYPEVPEPPQCVQQQLDKRVSTWSNGSWSPWSDWGTDPVWDDGRTRAGHHGGAHGAEGDRHFAYVVVDSRPITDGDCAQTPGPAELRLTFIQECGTFTPLDGPWVAPENVRWRLRNSNAEPVEYALRQAGGATIEEGMLPVGDTFVTTPFGERTLILETYNAAGDKVAQDTKAGGDTFLTTDDDEAKCLPPTPDDEVTSGEWVGEPECDQTKYVQTRTVTTTPYVWDGDEFVPDAVGAVLATEKRTVEVKRVERCPVTPVTDPPVTDPPVTDPPAVEPTVEPTVATTAPPAEAVAALPPTQTPTASAPSAPPTVPAAGLPATGGSGVGVTALIAMLATSLGGAALLVARRRNVTG